MSNFKKYKRGTITIEIQALIPEKFINLLWKNGINIKNVRKKSITTMTMEVELKDYGTVEEIAKKTKTKLRITGRKGLTFLMLKAKRRIAFVAGIGLFAGMIYFLSTFIWNIDIVTDHNLSPYEIRHQLLDYGIKSGIRKKSLDVYQIEDKMIRSNDNIMWFRARIEGSTLKIAASERLSPPILQTDNTPRNLVAKKDGQVIRVYTTAGTATVKSGDIVKAGQIIVKGEQGKEGSIYPVHASGNVIAKTFYEEIKEVPVKGVIKERTGNKIENLYIQIRGRKFYIKNSLNNFNYYDKIEDNKSFIKKDTYYELKEASFSNDPKKVVDDTVNELYSKISVNLDKSVKVLDKIVDSQPVGDNYRVRIVVIAEENVALPEKTQ